MTKIFPPLLGFALTGWVLHFIDWHLLIYGVKGDDPAFIWQVSLGIAMGIMANYYAILAWNIKKNIKIAIIWLELILAFMALCFSFNLSYEFIGRNLPYLIYQGVYTTIWISMVAIILAIILALLGALGKLSANPFAYSAASFYISFFRGIPLLMQLFLIYVGLPQLGIVLSPISSGIAALSICYGAYMAEIFRSGIISIPRGQHEAAHSLGLSPGQTMFKIIMPQAFKVVVPPTGNQFITMLKDSALVSIVGVWELTFVAKTQGKAEFKHFEMLLTASILYWLMSMVFEYVQYRIEEKYKTRP